MVLKSTSLTPEEERALREVEARIDAILATNGWYHGYFFDEQKASPGLTLRAWAAIGPMYQSAGHKVEERFAVAQTGWMIRSSAPGVQKA